MGVSAHLSHHPLVIHLRSLDYATPLSVTESCFCIPWWQRLATLFIWERRGWQKGYLAISWINFIPFMHSLNTFASTEKSMNGNHLFEALKKDRQTAPNTRFTSSSAYSERTIILSEVLRILPCLEGSRSLKKNSFKESNFSSPNKERSFLIKACRVLILCEPSTISQALSLFSATRINGIGSPRILIQ